MKHWPKFTIIVVFISFLCSCVSQSNISKQVNDIIDKILSFLKLT